MLLRKLQGAFPKSNTCEPSMKNVRFSGKKVSNAERLSTAGSTSTWPKSGLIVASSVRFDVRRSFRSSPARSVGRACVLNGSPGAGHKLATRGLNEQFSMRLDRLGHGVRRSDDDRRPGPRMRNTQRVLHLHFAAKQRPPSPRKWEHVTEPQVVRDC